MHREDWTDLLKSKCNTNLTKYGELDNAAIIMRLQRSKNLLQYAYVGSTRGLVAIWCPHIYLIGKKYSRKQPITNYY